MWIAECITTKCVRVFYVCFPGDKISLPDVRVVRLVGLHMLSRITFSLCVFTGEMRVRVRCSRFVSVKRKDVVVRLLEVFAVVVDSGVLGFGRFSGNTHCCNMVVIFIAEKPHMNC